MRALSIIATMSLVFMIGSIAALTAGETDEHVTKSQDLVQAFAKRLKAELQQAI